MLLHRTVTQLAHVNASILEFESKGKLNTTEKLNLFARKRMQTKLIKKLVQMM